MAKNVSKSGNLRFLYYIHNIKVVDSLTKFFIVFLLIAREIVVLFLMLREIMLIGIMLLSCFIEIWH